MRANAFKGRRLGNLAFWAGLSLGSAAVVALYARDAHWK